jgi:tetratricopeptide (TPR) repeat protein
VRRLLESLARPAPVLLVLDDVHWAEPALLDLVDYLEGRTEGPLLVLCLARREVERTPGQVFALDRLADEETRAIVAGTAKLDEATQARVVAAAEGNPLYAEQLATFAAESGEGLPPSLEAVLAGRLGRLQPPERRVLQRAAVLGREFTVGGVAALAQAEVTRELLSLARAGFVHPAPADPGEDGYTFHHVLLRDAAYAGLTKADRAELHERAAAWVDRDGPGDDATAGYHLEQAVRWRRELDQDNGDLAAVAGERLGEAGMRAWRASDAHAAIGLLERAVSLLPQSERRAELSLELSLAHRISGHVDEAARAATTAEDGARAAGSERLLARLECERAQTSLMSGDLTLDAAAATVANAMPAIRSAGDSRGLARAELILSNVHWFACRLEELAAAAARAETHYREAGFSGGVAVGIQAEALYHGPTPVPQALARCTELLDRLPKGPAQAVAMTVLGGLRGLEGDLDDARSLLAHARSLFEEFGNEGGILTTWTSYVVELEATIGDPAAAGEAARSNVERLMAMRDIAHATSHAALFSYGLLDAGEAEEAERCVAVAEAHRLGSDVYTQFMSRGARARLLAREGEFDAAEAAALDALAIVELTDALRDRARLHLALGEVLHLAGRRREARSQVVLARKLLRQKGARALLDRHRLPVAVRP